VRGWERAVQFHELPNCGCIENLFHSESANVSGELAAAKGWPQPPECYDLWFCLFAQDIAHAAEGYTALRRNQCPE